MNKEEIVRIWRSRSVQITLDACRVILILIAALILYVLVREINIVKDMGQDPCKLCMNKTGATCFYIENNSIQPANNFEVNMSFIIQNVVSNKTA